MPGLIVFLGARHMVDFRPAQTSLTTDRGKRGYIMEKLLGFGHGSRTATAKVGKPPPPTELVGFDSGAKTVTAKIGGKGGPIIIIPPDDGPDDGPIEEI